MNKTSLIAIVLSVIAIVSSTTALALHFYSAPRAQVTLKFYTNEGLNVKTINSTVYDITVKFADGSEVNTHENMTADPDSDCYQNIPLSELPSGQGNTSNLLSCEITPTNDSDGYYIYVFNGNDFAISNVTLTVNNEYDIRSYPYNYPCPYIQRSVWIQPYSNCTIFVENLAYALHVSAISGTKQSPITNVFGYESP